MLGSPSNHGPVASASDEIALIVNLEKEAIVVEGPYVEVDAIEANQFIDIKGG